MLVSEKHSLFDMWSSKGSACGSSFNSTEGFFACRALCLLESLTKYFKYHTLGMIALAHVLKLCFKQMQKQVMQDPGGKPECLQLPSLCCSEDESWNPDGTGSKTPTSITQFPLCSYFCLRSLPESSFCRAVGLVTSSKVLKEEFTNISPSPTSMRTCCLFSWSSSCCKMVILSIFWIIYRISTWHWRRAAALQSSDLWCRGCFFYWKSKALWSLTNHQICNHFRMLECFFCNKNMRIDLIRYAICTTNDPESGN